MEWFVVEGGHKNNYYGHNCEQVADAQADFDKMASGESVSSLGDRYEWGRVVAMPDACGHYSGAILRNAIRDNVHVSTQHGTRVVASFGNCPDLGKMSNKK